MSEETRTGRTMADIAARYDERRNAILARIREGLCSASMSGIEYCPKPWAELDVTDPLDRLVISGAITWDAEAKRHDLEGLRKLTEPELDARDRLSKLFFEPCGPGRDATMDRINREIRELRVAAWKSGGGA